VAAPPLAAMAWRNLWRQRRRTLLTLSSIAFGTMCAVLFTGIADANWSEMIDLAARTGAGHVTLENPDYFDAPTAAHALARGERLRALALRDPGVERAAIRIRGQLMLSTAGHSDGAAFVAFDPDAEDARTLAVLAAPLQGRWPASSGESGIVLGARLAEHLGARLGRKVVYTLTDRHGELVQEAARVTGIVRSGVPQLDAGLCLLALDRMRRTLRYDPGEATQLALFLRDQSDADRVAARLARALGPQVAVLPWQREQPDLAGFIAMKVAAMRILEGLILVLVAAGIFNTLFVSVMERLREFGILAALGFGASQLFALVLLESLWIGLLGLAAGALVTAGPYAWLALRGFDYGAALGVAGSEVAGVTIPTLLTARIAAGDLAWIAAAVLGATALSGLYPAWRAGRVEVVRAIRLA
jgi:ABC-type lipoprotein release transport system permease subunit